MNLSPHQVLEMATDHRGFHEMYDVVFEDNIYKPANFCVEVFDKFGRKNRTIFGNVFPKVGEPFDIYNPTAVAHGLMNHLYDMAQVHRQHTMQAIVFPWAGLHVRNLMKFVRGELPMLSVANGVVVDDTVRPVRVPVAAKHLLLANAVMELRSLFKDGYRAQKMAQFLERWKSFIADFGGMPKNEDGLSRALEHCAALHDREFEYWPEGVGTVWTIGGNVTIKYRKSSKSVLIETAHGDVSQFDLPTQGQDIVGFVLQAITGAPHNGLMGIHDGVGYAAIDGLKERLTYCPDDRLVAFVRSTSEFEVVRHDRDNHKGVLVTAMDHHNQAYLIFVMEKNGAFVRKELHTANRIEISDFYNVIAKLMDVNNG
jgi:hypothetical protein